MSSWFKVYRKIQKHPIWQVKPFSPGQAWIDLVMSASYKDRWFIKRGIKAIQKRGQVATSIKGLSDRWGWSQGKTKRFLTRLKNEDQIDEQNTNVTTLITIINYDEYQGSDDQNGEQTESRRGADGDKQEVKEGKRNIPTSDEVGSEQSPVPPCPHKKIIDIFHSKCTTLKRVQVWNDSREASLRSRWREDKSRQNLQFWEMFFIKVNKSDFLSGKVPGRDGKPPFLPSIDWLLAPKNFAKIIEGYYDNRVDPKNDRY